MGCKCKNYIKKVILKTSKTYYEKSTKTKN